MSDEKTPGVPAASPTALQQLEAALAAGAITPELFDTLRGQLPPAALGAAPAPPATSEELPPLLELFNQQPTAPILPAVAPPPPPAASPVAASAEDRAARQRIEAQLAQLRQKPPVAAPSFLPEPRPTPSFLPEPRPAPPASPAPHPALAFLPTPPPAPPVSSAVPSEEKEAAASRSRLPLWLLGLAVLGALAYFFTRSSHPDESLTSPRDAAASPAPTRRQPPKPPGAASPQKSNLGTSASWPHHLHRLLPARWQPAPPTRQLLKRRRKRRAARP